MNEDTNIDFTNALCKVKGYRHSFLKLLGILFVFFSCLIFGIVFGERNNVSAQTLWLTGVVCGIICVPSLGLVVYDSIAQSRITNTDCVVLFETGMTVFVDKPKAEKGYKHFSFDEIQDYGFVNIVRKNDSGETKMIGFSKKRSSETYLYADLMNYGYMRISTKSGGYYNVPVGDIQTVRSFMQEHTQIEEFIYMRIAGIHDDIIIKLE